jgi:hypothetical protein
VELSAAEQGDAGHEFSLGLAVTTGGPFEHAGCFSGARRGRGAGGFQLVHLGTGRHALATNGRARSSETAGAACCRKMATYCSGLAKVPDAP